MASTTSLPLLRPRNSRLVYEQHPDLGDYVYTPSIDLWTNRRVTSDGHKFLLAGRSRRPSEEEVRLWCSIEDCLEDLVAKAIAAIEAPPDMPRRRQFSREHLSLREVRMESGGVVELYFHSPLGDELHVWPVATFLHLELQGCEWAA
jgi:hypothetical protein